METKQSQRNRLTKRLLKKHGKENLIQCKICNKYFLRPCQHARQVHKISAKEYKREFGLDNKKGITTESDKNNMRQHTKENYDVVVLKNLLKEGQSTRFKKGDKTLGKYERSEQTMNRLKGNT